MGILLRFDRARERFRLALAMAVSNKPLPSEWLERSRKVGEMASRTFTPMLGTALLAKATDDSVDALALKEGDSHKSYSARNLATHVLVPMCVEAGISLRTSGREPLNNQPFFRYERVSRDMKIKSGRSGDLDFLVGTLERADFLRGDQAVKAFAAFLRTRLADPATRAQPLLIGKLDLSDLKKRVQKFLATHSDGGKVGQAFVAGVLSLVFADVQTARVNDPSHLWPGDVLVRGKPSETVDPVMSVEVKQRYASASEIQQFISRLSASGVARGMVTIFTSRQITVGEASDIVARAWESDSVLLSVFQDSDSLLEWSAQASELPLDEFVRQLPNQIALVLQDLEVEGTTLQSWMSVFTDVLRVN